MGMELEQDNNMVNKTEDTGVPVSSLFHTQFLHINHISETNFKEWLFTPGMLFKAREKWWGSGGQRTTPHEGIDLKYFSTTDNKQLSLEPGFKIPVLFAGQVGAVIDDFLGKSVFIRHPQFRHASATLFTAYGHTLPEPEIQEGFDLREGDIIGTIAETKNKNTIGPPHLHVSAAWIADNLLVKDISWRKLNEPGISRLVDPLSMLKAQYAVTVNPCLK
jgi:hypothetical protein